MNQTIFAHFKKRDPAIHAVIQEVDYHEWFRSDDPDNYLRALCREIIGQQLSGKVAAVIFARFLDLFPAQVVSTEGILAVEEDQLRETGMAWSKVRSIKDLAQQVAGNQLDLARLETLDDTAVIEELVQIKGIGPWTAEMFLIFTLQREDVFSFGDLGLKKGFSKVYQIEEPTLEQIAAVIEKWTPYKTFGAIALWHSLDPPVESLHN